MSRITAIRCALIAWAVGGGIAAKALAYPDVTWTGAGVDDSWATTQNWNPQAAPLAGDNVFFADAGASNSPGVTTNFLPGNQTVANLSYANDAAFHTTNLQGHQLSVSGALQINTNKNGATQTTITNGTLELGSTLQPGNLYVGRNLLAASSGVTAALDLSGATFNATLNSLIAGQKGLGGSSSGTATLLGGSSGDIVVGSQASPGTINIGRTDISGSSSGFVDFANQDSFTATVGNLWLGTADGGQAVGTFYLAPDNTIDASSIRVGYSNQSDNPAGTSILRLGAQNVITADEFIVGGRKSNGSLEIVAGGSLQLGTAQHPTALFVGRNDQVSNFEFTASVNLQGATVNAYLSQLVIADKTAGDNGSTNASLTGGNQGAIVIGSAEQPGDLIVGRNTQGATSVGRLDLGGQDSLTAFVDRFYVGHADSGSARGIVTLAHSNLIEANAVRIGSATASANSQTSSLALGDTNTILADSFAVGGNLGNGTVTIPVGGLLQLGSSDRRTALSVGQNTSSTSSSFNASMNLSGATFHAHLSQLAVGDKTTAAGSVAGTLFGAVAGDVEIGTAAARGNLYVGRSVSGGTAQGLVDLSGLGSLSAHLQQMIVGSNGTGTLVLPAATTIDTTTMVVGANGNATLTLGAQTTLLVDDLQIANSYGQAAVQIANPHTLNLGSADRPTRLSIGDVATDTNSTYGANVDFGGATLNAYLSDLTVGYKDNGLAGATKLSFNAGSAGSLQLGLSGNTANMRAGVGTTATVDFSGLDHFDAHANQILLGTLGGSANVSFAKVNVVDAHSLTVGNSGNATLTLGLDNTLLVDEFKVGMNYSSGTVLIPSGGTLSLGSAERPAHLTIGSGFTNTNSTHGGVVDLTNATFHAQLGNVILGQKDSLPGRQQGTLTISNHAGNNIVADSIFLGGTNADGRLNFGGGTLAAGSITRGDGTAVFNWQGGTLTVDSFGTPSKSFNLENTNFGTLAAGYSSSLTRVFGQYTQGAVAALAIDEHAGVFDQLVVAQSASLNGSLKLSLEPGFSLPVGDSVTILTASVVTGQFSHVSGYYSGGNTFLYPVYHPTFVELQAYLAGDGNFDGLVEGADYTTWADHYLQSASSVTGGDYNGDGIVDGADYVIWADHFTGNLPSAAFSAVPEPSSWLLAICGAVGLGLAWLHVRGKR